MKKILTVLALVFSFSAAADSIKIFEKDIDRGEDLYSIDYQVNKSLNRAWVQVTTVESFSDDSHYTDERALVPNLSYDAVVNGIVYNLNGEQVVCGTFYNRRWTIDFGMSVRETGRCKFENKIVKVQVDNGYEIYTKKVLQVFLNVQ